MSLTFIPPQIQAGWFLVKKFWFVPLWLGSLIYGYNWHLNVVDASKTALNASWTKKIDEVRVHQLETEKSLLEAVIASNDRFINLKKKDEIVANKFSGNVTSLLNALDKAAINNRALTNTGAECRTDGSRIDSVLRESLQENVYLAREAQRLQRKLGGLQEYVRDLERELNKNDKVL
jgi:hypothetical protein